MAKAKKSVKAKSPRAHKAETSGKSETNLVRRVTAVKKNAQIAGFRPGDSVNVFVKVKEGEKERIQIFKGIVTKLQGSGAGRSFTVRKISAGVGVERTFPFASPVVEKVELLTVGQVRRAKLYFLRGLEGKAAKINSEIASPKSSMDQVADEKQAE